MALFLSTFINKIDKKGRLSVPSQFRAVLAGESFNGVIAYPSFINDCVEACGMSRMEKMYESIDGMDPFSEERDAFAASVLGASAQLPFDSEGRIVLADSLIAAAGLTEQAVFVGKGANFEIWEPARFNTYAEQARKIAKEKRDMLRVISSGVPQSTPAAPSSGMIPPQGVHQQGTPPQAMHPQGAHHQGMQAPYPYGYMPHPMAYAPGYPPACAPQGYVPTPGFHPHHTVPASYPAPYGYAADTTQAPYAPAAPLSADPTEGA